MATIYRYQCDPNYPVISAAFVIFAMQPWDVSDPWEVGRMLAKECACSYVEQEERLDKIAENAIVLMTEGVYNGYQILHSENGEY